MRSMTSWRAVGAGRGVLVRLEKAGIRNQERLCAMPCAIGACSAWAGGVSAVPQETRSNEAQTRPTMSTIILDMARKILKRS